MKSAGGLLTLRFEPWTFSSWSHTSVWDYSAAQSKITEYNILFTEYIPIMNLGLFYILLLIQLVYFNFLQILQRFVLVLDACNSWELDPRLCVCVPLCLGNQSNTLCQGLSAVWERERECVREWESVRVWECERERERCQQYLEGL